jgi:hypothetical protein
MSDASSVARSLRERFSGTTEERLGKALSDLLENPILTGAIGRAFDAREKAVQAQEVAMGALNIPSAADIERLTRRLRSVSLRLEGIEEGVDRLEGAVSSPAAERSDLVERLSAIEGQLERLTDKVDRVVTPQGTASTGKTAKAAKPTNTAKAEKPTNTAKAAKTAKRPAKA